MSGRNNDGSNTTIKDQKKENENKNQLKKKGRTTNNQEASKALKSFIACFALHTPLNISRKHILI